MITVCLLNWRRPHNLPIIVDRLRRQSARPRIFLWNNAPDLVDVAGIDWRIDSSRNALCPPRWWMAAHADTEYVMSLDDDLVPSDDDVLRDAVDCARTQPRDRAIGPFGVTFRPGAAYFPHDDARCPTVDTPVDMVQGRCIIVRADALRASLRFGDFFHAAAHGSCDDIALCGRLARGRRRHHLVPRLFHGRIRELPCGNVGLEHRPEHPRQREEARARWFV